MILGCEWWTFAVNLAAIVGSLATAGALIFALWQGHRETVRRREAIERAAAEEEKAQARMVWHTSHFTGEFEWPSSPKVTLTVVNGSGAPIQSIVAELTDGWAFEGEYRWQQKWLLLPSGSEVQTYPVVAPEGASWDLTVGPPFKVSFFDNARRYFTLYADGRLERTEPPAV